MNAAALLFSTLCLAPQDGVAEKLRTMKLDVAFEAEPLESVVRYFADATGLNFVLDPEADRQAPVTIRLKGVRAETALRAILRELELAAVVRDGLVVIGPGESVAAGMVTQVYDLRDLFVTVNAFPGPLLELTPGTRAGGGVGVEVTWPEDAADKVLDENLVEELVREMTGGRTWDDDRAEIRWAPNRMLIVTQSAQAHKEIEALLAKLRWFK